MTTTLRAATSTRTAQLAISVCFAAMLVGLPLVYRPVDSAPADGAWSTGPKSLLLLACALGIGLAAIRAAILRGARSVSPLAMIALAGFGVTTAVATLSSASPLDGMPLLRHSLIFIVVFSVAASGSPCVRVVRPALVASGAIAAALVVAHDLGYPPPGWSFVPGISEPAGTYVNRNTAGFTIAVSVPVAFHLLLCARGRLIAVAALWTLVLLGLVYARSRGPWLAALIGCGVALWSYRVRRGTFRPRAGHRMILAPLVILVVVLAARPAGPENLHQHPHALLTRVNLFDDHRSVSTRFALWKTAGYLIAEHPMLGVGPGQFRSAARDYLPEPELYDDAHNQLVHTAAEAGLPAGGFLALFALAWLRQLVRRRSFRRSGGGPGMLGAVAALLLLSMCEVTITNPMLCGIAAAVLGATAGCRAAIAKGETRDA